MSKFIFYGCITLLILQHSTSCSAEWFYRQELHVNLHQFNPLSSTFLGVWLPHFSLQSKFLHLQGNRMKKERELRNVFCEIQIITFRNLNQNIPEFKSKHSGNQIITPRNSNHNIPEFESKYSRIQITTSRSSNHNIPELES